MAHNPYAKWNPFGSELQRLRTESGITQRTLASKINISQAMLGGIERSERAPRKEHADNLDAALNTGGSLLRIWHDISGKRDVPEWFKNALFLERKAIEIRVYEPLVIPGVLQTADYARCLLAERQLKYVKEEVDRAVNARVERLPELRDGRNPVMIFIIRESVFTQLVGDETIMARQLRHITKLVNEGAIQVQILPTRGPSTGLCLPFMLLKLADTRNTVAYVEHVTEGEVFDAPRVIDDLSNLFGQLQGQALSPADSHALLLKILGESYDDVAHQ